MISISYLYEQEEMAPEEQGPPGNITDRIYARAMARVVTPEQSEEEGIEAEVGERMAQEKRAAKVSARQAEERNRDTELKQLKAAEGALSAQAAEDTKSMEQGIVSPRVLKDKEEQVAASATPPEGNSQGQTVREGLSDYI